MFDDLDQNQRPGIIASCIHPSLIILTIKINIVILIAIVKQLTIP